MDNVLLVDSSADFRNIFGRGLKRLRQFKVFVVSGGREAIEVLSAQRIDVLVTGLKFQDSDALDLLSFMSRNSSETPCIVMTEEMVPRFRTPLPVPAFLTYLGKPFNTGELASSVLSEFNLIDSGGHVRGMPLAALLPLAECLRKTCRMQIGSEEKGIGEIYFRNGILLDASFDRLTGESAALELATWDRIVFDVSKLPDDFKDRRIATDLMEIADAEWVRKEEPTEEIIVLEDVVTIGDGGVPLETSEEEINLPEEIAEPPDGREAAERLLKKFLADVQYVKGYRGSAVVAEDGRILAADSKEDSPDWVRYAGEQNRFFLDAAEKAERVGFGKPDAITLHTASGTVLIQQVELDAAGSAVIILLSSLQGNWYYFKVRLENQKVRPKAPKV